jgi:hypothetical protein
MTPPPDPSLYPLPTSSFISPHTRNLHIPGIRLKSIGNDSERTCSSEAPVHGVFPPLLLILLAGLDTEEPSGWGVVAGSVT